MTIPAAFIDQVFHELPFYEDDTKFIRFVNELHQALPEVGPSLLLALPVAIWGKIASYHVTHNLSECKPFFSPMHRVSRLFSAMRHLPEFCYMAFCGNENQVANSWITHALPLGRSLNTPLQMHIGCNVREVRYCSLHSSLTIDLLEALATLYPNTVKMRLSSCQITDKHISTFSKFRNLQSLTLVGNPVTGATFAQLPPSLVEFRCIMSRISSNALALLARLPNLRQLELPWNRDFLCVELMQFSPALKSLTFNESFMSDAFMGELIKRFIQNGRSLKTEWLVDLAMKRQQKSLNLDNVKDYGLSLITPDTLADLVRLFPRLESLSLENCRLTDKHVQVLANFLFLRELNIGMNANICGRTLGLLPKSLTKFQAHSCSITDKAIARLVRGRKIAILLDLRNNPRLRILRDESRKIFTIVAF